MTPPAAANPYPAASRLRGLWLTVGWLLVALVIYLSLRYEPAPLIADVGDKLQHILAYSVLMLWFSSFYLSKISRIGYACGFLALGIALEFIQGWSGYRSFEIADMVADAIGVSLGWALAPPRLPSLLLLVERRLKSAGKD